MKTKKMWAVYQEDKLICIGTSRRHDLTCVGIYAQFFCNWSPKELKEQYSIIVKQVNVIIEAIKE